MTQLCASSLVTRLGHEFQQSMKSLLLDLCRDLERSYSGYARRYEVPTSLFRYVALGFSDTCYSHWRVVGWIETMNDLVYFIDLLQQFTGERDRRSFAEQCYAECEGKFFENSYLDELFPHGRAQATGLASRLEWLCMRLARELNQEAVLLDPQRAIAWSGRSEKPYQFVGTLEQQFERGEEPFIFPTGIDGDEFVAPAAVRKSIGPSARVSLEINHKGIILHATKRYVLCAMEGSILKWHWARRKQQKLGRRSATPRVGSTLRYGKNREPQSVVPTSPNQRARVTRAWQTIEKAWPEGYGLLKLLTSHIIPLNARGVVSFSYRHRPGLSFINCFHRGNLDLIDDLIHENSHHHLNLLLRKHVLYGGDRNQQIFYSPWRRSLRPIRGILHAAFTFTMGAILFERLSSWAMTHGGRRGWKQAGLTASDLVRARFRCLEEIESVRYSLEDLRYAGRRLKWLTGSGVRLVRQLEDAIGEAECGIAPHREQVMASRFGPAFRRHVKALRAARRNYGLSHLHSV
ncbi:hypothetical protein W02_15190 [Nitrospira sp. KM1]|uniref:aKG-HExxH-type peptide beta-hydroxylase n=1 Tax=Nitrospira sp. KM1 TaxID=1936990 RepID=UPI0013A7988E|nr:HEXXH motif-containing putative peptide modification protein [Nitrospira sp. KM1]BCA54379.1 hypothetical protein W02_15190 [Nitrospira sp. KM1]